MTLSIKEDSLTSDTIQYSDLIMHVLAIQAQTESCPRVD